MLLRGMRYRAGRSAVVALLAMVAVAAAVLAPGYARAAQQSVLTDGLASSPPVATGLTVSAAGTAAGAPGAHEPIADARLRFDAALAGHPTLAGALASPVAGVDTDTIITGGDEPLAARIAYRDGVCDHLTVAGDCPTGDGEVLISARTADDHGLAPGDTLTMAGDRQVAVVGTYAPVDATAPYWGRTAYFTHGGFDAASGAPRVDAIFTGGEADVQADPAAVVTLGLTYPVRPRAVRLDDVPGLRADLRAFDGAVRVGGFELTTALPSILDEAAADQDAIARSAPVIAVPLVLLSWFVLFLLVAALTEERGREIALAKLRGFSESRAARFGLGEVLVLIMCATPVGVALGLGLVELVARMALADGTHVEVRWPVLAAAAAALVATALAAVLAARQTLRRGVLELLRRVPARARWRGVTEAVVVALAAASLVAAIDDRGGPLALLAPALLAVGAGVAAARLVRLWAAVRLRLRHGRRTASIPGLLSAAQLARRPAGARVMVVVTVAIALLGFAATAWDVAAQARDDHATDDLGADRVYVVAADHPSALVDAVHAADPGGTSMAVVRTSQQYAGEAVELLAVEAPKLAEIAQWRGRDPAAVAALAGQLRPPAPEPLRVADRVRVTANVIDLGDEPVRLSALVSAPGAAPRAVSLGTLAPDRRRYSAALAGCDNGCRLLGLVLGRAGASGTFTATVSISAIESGGPLAARFDEPGAWRGPVTPGRSLRVEVAGDHSGDVVIEHQDAVAALPVVVAGAAPADPPDAAEFRFPGFAEQPQPFIVVDRVDRLPRAGERGLLVDVDYAVRDAERTVALSDGALRYEVWAGPDAPADLPRLLAAAGVPVLRGDSMAGAREQLSRRAPALGWWLFLLAGAAAVALALGVVLLSTRVGVETRLHELAALRVTGVRTGLLRRGLLREQVALLGGPMVVGFAVGVAGAALMLPGIPLVEVSVVQAPSYRPQLGALPVAVAAVAAALLLAGLRAVRLPDRATPDRLREGV